MPDYRRNYINGGTYFFTVVTYQRQPVFNNDKNIDLLRNCFRSANKKHPFRIDAIVILPDHLHTIWTLPVGEYDFSVRWKVIKSSFTRQYSSESAQSFRKSLIMKGERTVWQRRFWEHTIRDQDDFNKHCDYIHYNPVKHEMVENPNEWEYSSFNRFVDKGIYDVDWGQSIDERIIEMNLE